MQTLFMFDYTTRNNIKEKKIIILFDFICESPLQRSLLQQKDEKLELE